MDKNEAAQMNLDIGGSNSSKGRKFDFRQMTRLKRRLESHALRGFFDNLGAIGHST
jgi:hypothetical protein